MARCLFLAGAAGAIGRRLAPLLVMDGWRVVGTTRSDKKAPILREMGVEPVIIDVFNADALRDVMAQVRPSIVVHQLTDLPPGLDPAKMAEATTRNARIRDAGTRSLVSAAVHAGVQRLIAQSIAFAYADGPLPHGEDDPLNTDAEGARGVSARGVASLEHQVLEAPLDGIVLRYGRLYGPGTGFDAASGPGPVHVDAAARAAQLAVTRGLPGIYNIAEDDGAVSSEKAKRLLDWNAGWGGPVTPANPLAETARAIRYVDSDSEAAVCYELMRQLRPHLHSEQEFVERWRRQASVGYRLLVLWQGPKPVALAGFRVQDNLVHGPHFYVDDLVTDEALRSDGYGHALMERLKTEARALGCPKLVLDTPLTNTLGHRFYYREGLLETALRFSILLV